MGAAVELCWCLALAERACNELKVQAVRPGMDCTWDLRARINSKYGRKCMSFCAGVREGLMLKPGIGGLWGSGSCALGQGSPKASIISWVHFWASLEVPWVHVLGS